MEESDNDGKKKSKDVTKKIRENTRIAQELTDSIKGKSETITSLLNELEKVYTENSQAYKSIDKIKQSCDEIFSMLQDKVDDIKELAESTETFFGENFEPLKKRIEDEDDGLQAILDFSDQAHDRIAEIDGKVSEYKERLNSLSKIELVIKSALDPDEGFSKKLEHITKVKSQVDDLYGKINNSIKLIQEFEGKIDSINKEANANLKNIQDVKDKAEEYNKHIGETYKVFLNTAKGGVFDTVRKEFMDQRKKWLKWTVFSVIILAVVAAVLTWWQIESPSVSMINNSVGFYLFLVLRYLLLSPFIYLIVFCANQYKLARLSAEKYTFKTVVSFSFEGELKTLHDRFGYDPSILKFAIQNLEKLYDEPYYDEGMKMKFRIQQEQIRFGGEAVERKDDLSSENNSTLDKEKG